MANVSILVWITAIAMVCFQIECASALKPRLSNNIRPNKRTLGAVDLNETLKNGVNAFKGIGAVMQHTTKGELESLKAEEPSVPGSSTSEFGVSTADSVPAGGNKKTPK